MITQSRHTYDEPLKEPMLPIGSKVVPFLGLPYRNLNMNPKKELLWWVSVFWGALGLLSFSMPCRGSV